MATVRTTAATLFIIAASMIFGWIVVVYRVSDKTLALMSAYVDSPTMVMLFIIVTMMIPRDVPRGDSRSKCSPCRRSCCSPSRYDIDPIHLGVVVVLTIMLGALTPPVGLVLYTVMATSGVKIQDRSSRRSVPFYVVLRGQRSSSSRWCRRSIAVASATVAAGLRNVSFASVGDDFPIKRDRAST